MPDSNSNSPGIADTYSTLGPKELKSVFNTIKEETRESGHSSRTKRKLKRVRDVKTTENEDRLKKRKPRLEEIIERPKTAKTKLKKHIISKKIIKHQEKKNSEEISKHLKKKDKGDIKDYMTKKNKEYKIKQNKDVKLNEKKQQKVFKNLQRLAKKSKKLLSHVSNSKTILHIQKTNITERSELGMTMNKNLSLLRTNSKNTLSANKLTKTQRKPKTYRIRAKVDSPSKIMSSDSELDDLSPRRYLDYYNVRSNFDSETAEKYRAMPLQRNLGGHHHIVEQPTRLDNLETD